MHKNNLVMKILSSKVINELKLDTGNLPEHKVRSIRTLFHILIYILRTKDESEYFKYSSEAMRLCASLIQQSDFIDLKGIDADEYRKQVLEYAMDMLQENIDANDVFIYDN